MPELLQVENGSCSADTKSNFATLLFSCQIEYDSSNSSNTIRPIWKILVYSQPKFTDLLHNRQKKIFALYQDLNLKF